MRHNPPQTIDSRFGKFRLLKRIGGGRLSQVFQVGPSSGSEVHQPMALKRVNPSLIGEPDFVQLVVREARLLARLDHRGLCTCQEMGTVDGCPFLTLDLVDGCTLRALMRRLSLIGVRLPVSAVLALGFQLAQVLDYLHRQAPIPLAHLDLSPQNVMISREGTVKLIDFGIARQLDGQNPPPVGGRIAGTVGYMSPEQARGAAVGAAADQFGLGILLWEVLTCRRLFRGNTPETWTRMRRGQSPQATVALREVPQTVRQLVEQLLAPEPERRFPQMEAAMQQMSEGISSLASGQQPLAALVNHLLADPDFDPFDVVSQPTPEPIPQDIPTGEGTAEEYAEISIEVDSGEGSPTALLRSALPGPPGAAPSSPFLETLTELEDGNRASGAAR